MGQARLRGTKDERIEQACQAAADRRAAEELEKAKHDAAERERIAALPPEQQKQIKDRQHRRHMEKAMLIGALGSAMFAPRRR